MSETATGKFTAKMQVSRMKGLNAPARDERRKGREDAQPWWYRGDYIALSWFKIASAMIQATGNNQGSDSKTCIDVQCSRAESVEKRRIEKYTPDETVTAQGGTCRTISPALRIIGRGRIDWRRPTANHRLQFGSFVALEFRTTRICVELSQKSTLSAQSPPWIDISSSSKLLIASRLTSHISPRLGQLNTNPASQTLTSTSKSPLDVGHVATDGQVSDSELQ
ncbi:hypothetical protein BO82DRAFT_367722 [Aspergillus uvarum CBS 121591]|uniref:Uncharacterized protein n=1 Tax=Aspergillus uvarum CBS 121591 TaxID=1448315 RepID=A0A319BZQ9_9EURO|nr:hypothetical protein BO82DRAFT_367722 [Aspergillus uvarum CBS 121591]PYH78294.1 hypothetical protein BO82DRAFT_367722 [Aspergillus uvarum CBS 121591]